MRRGIVFFVVAVFSVVFFVGCTGGNEELVDSSENLDTKASTESLGVTKAVKPVVQELQALVEGKQVIDIKSVDKGVVMLLVNDEGKNECYFWSLSENKLISNWTNLELAGDAFAQRTKGGIVLYSLGMKVYIGDEEYQLEKCLTIAEPCDGTMGFRNYCVLPKQEKIVYYQEEFVNENLCVGLYMKGFEDKNAEMICRLESPETNIGNVNIFHKICPSYHEDSIYFTGSYFMSSDDGTDAEPCIGCVRLQSKQILVEKTNKEELVIIEESAFFYDGLQELGKSSGQVIRFDDSGNVKYIETDNKEESQVVVLSDQGNYYTTYYEEISTNLSYINFYDTDSNKKFFSMELKDPLLTFCVIEEGQSVIGTIYDEITNEIKLVEYHYDEGNK